MGEATAIQKALALRAGAVRNHAPALALRTAIVLRLGVTCLQDFAERSHGACDMRDSVCVATIGFAKLRKEVVNQFRRTKQVT